MARTTFRFIVDATPDGNGGRTWLEFDTFHDQFLVLNEDQNGNVELCGESPFEYEEFSDAMAAYIRAATEASDDVAFTLEQVNAIENRWHGYQTGDIMPAPRNDDERDELATGRSKA